MTKASICTIGDEILIGQVVDTNSSHIAQALEAEGIKVSRMNLVVLHPELPAYRVVPVPVMEREINVILNKIK